MSYLAPNQEIGYLNRLCCFPGVWLVAVQRYLSELWTVSRVGTRGARAKVKDAYPSLHRLCFLSYTSLPVLIASILLFCTIKAPNLKCLIYKHYINTKCTISSCHTQPTIKSLSKQTFLSFFPYLFFPGCILCYNYNRPWHTDDLVFGFHRKMCCYSFRYRILQATLIIEESLRFAILNNHSIQENAFYNYS